VKATDRLVAAAWTRALWRRWLTVGSHPVATFAAVVALDEFVAAERERVQGRETRLGLPRGAAEVAGAARAKLPAETTPTPS